MDADLAEEIADERRRRLLVDFARRADLFDSPLVEDGDEISFGLLEGEITLHVSDEELTARREAWTPPELQHSRGYLADFAATVSQAASGCVSHWVT